MAAYATTADLEAFLHSDPGATAGALLDHAAELLDFYLIGSTYSVDGSSMPTDAAVILAFKQASCAQAEYWLLNGDEQGDLARINNYAIEGISVQFRSAPPRLAPRARDILAVAGLLPSRTPIKLP